MAPFERRNSHLNFTKKSGRPVPGPVLPNVADDVIGLTSMERGGFFSAQKMDIRLLRCADKPESSSLAPTSGGVVRYPLSSLE